MSIFSTYSTGENRVTASILAVLRSLSLGRIERLLAAMLEQSEFELVRFQNQPSKGGAGVPDAIIHASIRMLVETKTERNGLNKPQLQRHHHLVVGVWPREDLSVVIHPVWHLAAHLAKPPVAVCEGQAAGPDARILSLSSHIPANQTRYWARRRKLRAMQI